MGSSDDTDDDDDDRRDDFLEGGNLATVGGGGGAFFFRGGSPVNNVLLVVVDVVAAGLEASCGLSLCGCRSFSLLFEAGKADDDEEEDSVGKAGWVTSMYKNSCRGHRGSAVPRTTVVRCVVVPNRTDAYALADDDMAWLWGKNFCNNATGW